MPKLVSRIYELFNHEIRVNKNKEYINKYFKFARLNKVYKEDFNDKKNPFLTMSGERKYDYDGYVKTVNRFKK